MKRPFWNCTVRSMDDLTGYRYGRMIVEGVTQVATANDVLKVAIAEIGTKENPANSNKVKYNTWYYGKVVSGSAYPWCVTFQMWIFNQAGAAALLPVKTASCTALMNAAKKAGIWVTSGYKAGDVLIFDWGADRIPDHTGILEYVDGTEYHTIEGNTSVGNDSNGGEVMRRARYKSQILGAVRPKYGEDTMTSTEIMAALKADSKFGTWLIDQLQTALDKGTISANVNKELQEAKKLGITDATNPTRYVTRAQAGVMAKRAYEKARE